MKQSVLIIIIQNKTSLFPFSIWIHVYNLLGFAANYVSMEIQDVAISLLEDSGCD